MHRLLLGHLEAQVVAGLLERVELGRRELGVRAKADKRGIDLPDGGDQEQRHRHLIEFQLQRWWPSGQADGHLTQLLGLEVGAGGGELSARAIDDDQRQVVVTTDHLQYASCASALRHRRSQGTATPQGAGQVSHPRLREDRRGCSSHGSEGHRHRDLRERESCMATCLDERFGGRRRLLAEPVDDARAATADNGGDERVEGRFVSPHSVGQDQLAGAKIGRRIGQLGVVEPQQLLIDAVPFNQEGELQLGLLDEPRQRQHGCDYPSEVGLSRRVLH